MTRYVTDAHTLKWSKHQINLSGVNGVNNKNTNVTVSVNL